MRYCKYFSLTDESLGVDVWDETLTLLKYRAGDFWVLLIVLVQLHDKRVDTDTVYGQRCRSESAESVPQVLDNMTLHSQEDSDANP